METVRTDSSAQSGGASNEGVECTSAVDGRVRVDYGQWSDNQLVASFTEDCADAYGELYRRHMDSVMSAARGVLRNSTDSEDVAMEVFIQLWMAPERFDPSRGSVVGFLRMSAKRRSIDLIRSLSAQKRREVREFYEVAAPTADADAKLIARERADLLRQRLATLPDIEREAIEIAFYKGMTYTAVAIHLGLPEGTVKTRIRNGLRRMKVSDDIQRIREDLTTDVDSPIGASMVTDGVEHP